MRRSDDDDDDGDQWHGEKRMMTMTITMTMTMMTTSGTEKGGWASPAFPTRRLFTAPSATLPAVCIGTWLIFLLGTFGTWYWYTQNNQDLPSVCICKYQALCIPGSGA